MMQIIWYKCFSYELQVQIYISEFMLRLTVSDIRVAGKFLGTGWIMYTDGLVVRAGVSVTVLSRSGDMSLNLGRVKLGMRITSV